MDILGFIDFINNVDVPRDNLKSLFSQVFSCISRKLNVMNALSLPKMMQICDDAYTSQSVISHTVLENNFEWFEWLEPHVIPKSLMSTGMTKVSFGWLLWFACFLSHSLNTSACAGRGGTLH